MIRINSLLLLHLSTLTVPLEYNQHRTPSLSTSSRTPLRRDDNGKIVAFSSQQSTRQIHTMSLDNNQAVAVVTATTTTTNTVKNKNGRVKIPGKRWGAKNQWKMKHFVRWLMETFPQLDCTGMKKDQGEESSMTTDSTNGVSTTTSLSQLPPPLVLDIAGGKGELTARLCACCHLRVVMIDPRLECPLQCFHKTVLPKLPKRWRERIQDRLEREPEFLREMFHTRVQQMGVYFTPEAVAADPILRASIRDATILIGLHADGATEAIVDTALLFRKPFCVVPCCVFPNFNSHRFLRETSLSSSATLNDTDSVRGGDRLIPVRSYEQFCQYLYEKHPRFQRSILPFEGRNVAIWWDGQD